MLIAYICTTNDPNHNIYSIFLLLQLHAALLSIFARQAISQPLVSKSDHRWLKDIRNDRHDFHDSVNLANTRLPSPQ
jgi:hypothetical protein